MKRLRWDSRTAFVFAAIGSAAGLGNLWRFPYQVFSYGGGAFIIPYLIALLTAGIPLLILELAIGQKFQKAAPGTWRKIGKNVEGLGWWSTIVAFVIVCYYAVIMAWAFDYMYYSINIAWAGMAADFFFSDLLNISSGPGILGSISIPTVIGLLLAWIWIFISIRKGPQSASKMVWITVPLPIILIVLMIARGVTLDGASEGLRYYLTPKFDALLNKDVWLAAYSQVFFSLSVGMAIMISYASYKPKTSDITKNAFVIGFADTIIAFMSGFAVFSTLGYLALQQGVAVPDVASGGIGLAFVVFPTAVELMPVFSAAIGFVFFLTLLTLAIDSAFSLVEGINGAIVDTLNIGIEKTAAIVCAVMFLLGIFFTSGAGLYWLDMIDHYINNYGIALVGFVELVFIGWAYNTGKLREWINSVSEWKLGYWWEFCVKVLSPLGVGSILVMSLWDDFFKGLFKGAVELYEGYPIWANGTAIILVLIIVPLISWIILPILSRKPEDEYVSMGKTMQEDAQPVLTLEQEAE